MLYCGLPGRHFWLSAITAPRFLASAFAAGPALIVIACLIMKRVAHFDAGKEAINKLTTIIIYAAMINAFFVASSFLSAIIRIFQVIWIPLEYLFFGLEHNGHVYNNLVPFMWSSVLLCFGGLGLFAYMKIAKCIRIAGGNWLHHGIYSLWIDKGLGFVLGGLVVNPLGQIVEYYPNANEIGVTLGIWATGFFLVTILYKIAVGVEHEVEA